jgi:membrane protease YdiL (CAAX protease family)
METPARAKIQFKWTELADVYVALAVALFVLEHLLEALKHSRYEVFYATVGVPILFALWLHKQGRIRTASITSWWSGTFQIAGGAVAGLGLHYVGRSIAGVFTTYVPYTEVPIPFLMLGVLIVPIAEEAIFRGYFEERLLLGFSPLVAVTITAILSTVLHPYPQWAATFVRQLGYGFVYLVARRSIAASSAAHATGNLSIFLPTPF